VCKCERFVLYVIENRILRGTLEMLSPVVLSSTPRGRLDSTLAAFSSVSLVSPTWQMFRRVRLNRLSSYYERALRLCQLVLESGGIDLDTGDIATPGFFLSMADVFEKAIERALREEFGAQNVRHQPEYRDRIRVVDGEPAIPVTIRPDNVIGPRDAPWLIVDAKYKNPLRWYRDRQ
jgi:5-methylcytosine-specific restriction endonuclease McrBC regulatory subunit McrC